MKKQFLAAAMMVLLPLTASASEIGTYTLNVDYSKPIVDRYYGDYDIASYAYKSGTKINFAADNSPGDKKLETFCISKDELKNYLPYNNFTFYTSDYLIGKSNQSNSTIKYDPNTLNFVTWVANWSTTTGNTYGDYKTQDEVKALGQAAIWYALGVDKYLYDEYSWLAGIFTKAEDKSSYTSQWLIAMNGNLGETSICSVSNQDFLVKASPVPVPSTLLLLGSGLTGLVAAGRRRKQG